MPTDFPDERSLCEGCGYRLVGISPDGSCPECGRAAADSAPIHRTGLTWQNRPGVKSWIQTALAILVSPVPHYRLLRMGGANTVDRIYLGVSSLLAGVVWSVIWMAAGRPYWWLWGVWITGCVILLSYIEVLGVTTFSRRQGWPADWRRTERVVCYASAAWIPAVLILAKSLLLIESGVIWRYVTVSWGILIDSRDNLSFITVAILAMLWFEVIVWLGVRQTRFANEPVAAQSQSQV